MAGEYEEAVKAAGSVGAVSGLWEAEPKVVSRGGQGNLRAAARVREGKGRQNSRNGSQHAKQCSRVVEKRSSFPGHPSSPAPFWLARWLLAYGPRRRATRLG